MVGDIAWLIVRSSGGFWAFRERMLRHARGTIVRGIYQIVYYAYLQRYGAYIGHSARFASEPCFPHGLYGVFIAGASQLGGGCVIFQHVTIGANALPDSKGAGTPIVGNNVYIGAGAKIIGKVSVGNSCRIGANCVVTRDVPENAIVVLGRPDVLQRSEAPDNRYYRWSPEGPVYFKAGDWLKEMDQDVVERLRDAL